MGPDNKYARRPVGTTNKTRILPLKMAILTLKHQSCNYNDKMSVFNGKLFSSIGPRFNIIKSLLTD